MFTIGYGDIVPIS